MKQGETEAVTTYLECFYQNLCQIQAIDANYFTAPQILNQFIYGLCSSILQHVHLLHSDTLQDAVTCARDFESTESEANHAQAINLVMNGSSELDSKLEKFSESINKRLEGYLADNHTIYQSSQQCNNQENSNHAQNQTRPSSSTNQQWQQEMHICHYCDKQGHIQINCHQKSILKPRLLVFNSKSSIKLNTISNHLSINNTATNLSTTSISTSSVSKPNHLFAVATNNLSAAALSDLLTPTNLNITPKLSYYNIRKPKT
ncbi:hypothetical protein G9A89_016570 [Geosiphon pyriformis]|nr:hypothetical protein G9A89_016570 [Geosiphon pyriformis]